NRDSSVAIHGKHHDKLRSLIDKAVRTRADADEARIADLYESFVDEAAVERAGIAPLAGELAVIDALQSPAQLPAVFGRMTRLGVNVPLRMDIDQDSRDARRYVPQIVQAGLGLPDRDYYLVADRAQ